MSTPMCPNCPKVTRCLVDAKTKHATSKYSLRFRIKVMFGYKMRYEIKVSFGEISLKLHQTN